MVEAIVERCTVPGYGFEAAAVEAVKRWRYVPARVNGEVHAVYFNVVVDFRLH